MRKGKSFSQFRIKLYICLRSGFFYGLLAFLGTFISAVVSVIFNISAFLTLNNARLWDYSDLFFSLAAAIIAAYGAIRSGIALYRTYFSRQLIHSTMVKNDTAEAVTKKISTTYSCSGYKWGQYQNHRYLYSESVDDFLRDSNDIRLKVIPHKTFMGDNQKKLLYQIVKEKLAHDVIIFNGTLVRLRTDLLTNNKQKIVVQKTDYFSNMTSNDMIYTQAFETDFSKIYKGRDMTVDSTGSLFDLSDSPAANIIGVTTLAITSDGYAILNVQSNNNDVNNDCLVPSGSGSADFDDLKKASGQNRNKIKTAKSELKNARKALKAERKKVLRSKGSANNSETISPRIEFSDYNQKRDEYKSKLNEYRYLSSMRRYECSLNKFLTKGMQRELKEESYLTDEDIKCTYVCGYIRILDRGGKPDFFGITFLNCSKKDALQKFKIGKDKYVRAEISKNQQIADFNEVSEPRYIKVDQIYDCQSISNISEIENYKISLQLHCMEHLIKRNRQLIDENLA